jgi:hypothetical protein
MSRGAAGLERGRGVDGEAGLILVEPVAAGFTSKEWAGQIRDAIAAAADIG